MSDPSEVFAQRVRRLARMRAAGPRAVAAMWRHYAGHPADFVNDWGVTLDPRSIAKGKAALVPFTLWPKQRELVGWIVERWRRGEPGTVVKSRDVGASWITMALLAWCCIFERDFAAGVASATEIKLDRSGDPDTLFFKLREFLRHLPVEFNGGYSEEKTSAYLRIGFPRTGSSITGEAGDKAGRGGRKALVIVDESAHLERPQLIDANLSANTDCVIHMSSVNGNANAFYEKAHNPNIHRFDITWRDDPRKTLEWYEEKSRTLDPLIVAAEIDCDFSASTEGQLIPTHLIHAAVGAAAKLGTPASGIEHAGFDVADEGRDKCAVAIRHGIELHHLELWSAKGSDIFKSTQRAMGICDTHGARSMAADADGIGSAVRGDAEVINDKRITAGKPEIEVMPFRGSGAVADPDGSMIEGRTNRDHFANNKAQKWWKLKARLELTHRVIEAAERGDAIQYDRDELISIDPHLPHLNALIAELSQIRWVLTAAGRVLIDKQPDGVASPNLADAVMICFSSKTGAYFSGVRTAAATTATAPGRNAPMMPARLDKIFGSLVIAEDTAAIVFCAANNPDNDGSRGVALWVLDYDLRVLAEDADEWLLGLNERLSAVRDCTPPGVNAVLCGIYLDDYEQGWSNALNQLGLPTNAVGEELPPLPERFNKCRPYVTRGLVALGPVAARKDVSFKDSRRNFLREVVTTAAPQESSALALAFATAVLLTYHGRSSVPTPDLSPEQFPPPAAQRDAPPSTPMWQTATGVWVEGAPPEGHRGPVLTRQQLGF